MPTRGRSGLQRPRPRRYERIKIMVSFPTTSRPPCSISLGIRSGQHCEKEEKSTHNATQTQYLVLGVGLGMGVGHREEVLACTGAFRIGVDVSYMRPWNINIS